ncbi:DUF945 family protein [Reinekea sp.]|jgi:hypothetical protein|uniref:DUF945 family protein n=1 Tax=Reinekea sp. TaxID=1970455 RepID=UPI002A7FD4DF|nr:DUF945 family protein [Reinekea sp.]
MHKTLLISSLLVAGIVVAGAGTLLATDRQIDAALAQLQENTASSPFVIAVREDKSTLTERHLVLTASVEEEGQSISLVLDNEIQKRPWGAKIEHRLYVDESLLAQIEDEPARAIFRKFFLDQALISGTTEIGLTGNYQSELVGIAFDEVIEQTEVTVFPLRLAIAGDRTGHLTTEGSWQGATLRMDDLEQIAVSVRPMTFESEGQYLSGGLFLGEERFSGEGFSFNMTSEEAPVGYEIGAMTGQGTSQVIDERLVADGSFAMKKIAFNAGTEPVQLTDINLSFTMSGLVVENLQSLIQNLNSMQANGEPSPALMENASQILRDGFKMDLPQWQVSINGQRIALQAAFELPANDVADVSNPFSMLGLVSTLKYNAHLDVAGGLSELAVVAEPFNALMMTGVLVEKGADYQMDFILADGAATLNGEAVPLPF